MSTSESTTGRRGQFGWARRASAVAMARGVRRPLLSGRSLGDVRMDGVGSGYRMRPGLLVEAAFSHR